VSLEGLLNFVVDPTYSAHMAAILDFVTIYYILLIIYGAYG